jgi:transcriptional regulator with XRE-family HTH domain
MTDGALFGLELRRARERRGLSLDQLAEVTKVSGSLFAGLERGDVARWPGGIFRRAFVRSYAGAVGLDPEETLSRFLRLFPDAEGADAAAASAPAAAAEGSETVPRLVLDDSAATSAPRARRTALRTAAALLDLALAGAPAVVVSFVLGWQWFFPVAASVGLVGHLVAVALVGTSPGAWLLLPRPGIARRVMEEPQPPPRTDAEAVAPSPRRRQPRHAAPSTPRPVPAARTRRVQH